MGSGVSTEEKFASVEAAREAGKTDQEINDYIAATLPKIDGKNVLVTGAAGIGAAFAKLCIDRGAKVVYVVDRDDQVLAALDKSKGPGEMVTISCDVGTKEGPDKIAAAIGDNELHFVLLAAACPKNLAAGMGAPIADMGWDDLDDMIRTDCHGKLFVVQKLLGNLKAARDAQDGQKSRVFSIGAPFSDGPKPDGTYMSIPGWAGFGAAKAACKWIHEGMAAELKDIAAFGYGHPGLTKTPLIDIVAKDYNEGHLLYKMCNGRISKGDFHTAIEPARMFYSAMTATDDAEFSTTKWDIVKLFNRFGLEQGAKEISDVKGGIKIEAPKANE